MRNKNLIVESAGSLFVRTDAVMSPLIPFIDGLKVVYFPKLRHSYLKLETAVEWCRKEREHHSREKYDAIIATLEKIAGENLPADGGHETPHNCEECKP